MSGTIILSGSPRRTGNCNDALQIILERIAPHGRTATALQLNTLDIKRCRGCLNCQQGEHCAIEDDFASTWETVKSASTLVLIIPVYWCAPPGLMKDFIDRTVIDFNAGGVMKGKDIHLVSIAQSAGYEPQEKIVSKWTNWLGGSALKSTLRLIAFHRGELMKNASALKKLRALAETL